MNRSPDLTRRFFRLTGLNILSNLTLPLVGLVDIAMLGHLAEIRYLAGVALAAILFEYVYWTFGFLRMGTTGTTAQAIGRGDRAGSFLVLYRSLLLALGIAAALLLLQWPLREGGFALLAGATEVEEAGRAYFNARIWAAPATLCNFAFLGWYLGREESQHVLWMTVVGNLTNVALNYVFILRLGMAAFGAGLANMVSQYLMLLAGLVILSRKGPFLPWRWREVTDPAGLAGLLRLNRDILVRTVGLITAFALFMNFSSILGTTVLAANAILGRLQTLAAHLIDGAAFAAESLAGILRGAGDFAGLRRLSRLALAAGEGFAAVFLALFLAAPGPVIRLMTSHPEVTALAASHGPWLLPVLLLGAVAYMYDGLFLGLTAGRALRNSMFVSTVLVFLPAALLALALRSNHLLWAAMVLFMAARAVTLARASRVLLHPGREAAR